MLNSLLVASLMVVSMPTIAAAYCSKPDAPYCATRYGPFDDQYDFDRCKREMQSYRDDVQSFLSCLKRESDQTINDYSISSWTKAGSPDASRVSTYSFNRRARG